jgi:hypothetical protein
MERFKKFMLNSAKRYRFVPALIITGLALIMTAHAEERQPFRFNLVPASDTIAACLPDARATVTVFPNEEVRGVDTLDLRGENLLPNTTFTVFLTELADIPFGASEYIGEFTTNAAGRGSLRVDSVIDEAFSSTIVNGVRTRVDLNHIVLWFADPAGDDACFGAGLGPVTPFDGDGEAGSTLLSSKNFLPGAPLP